MKLLLDTNIISVFLKPNNTYAALYERGAWIERRADFARERRASVALILGGSFERTSR